MIITEGKVKYTGKKYNVKIQCVATRRLTALEWLIVHSVATFSNIPDERIKVKYEFENVLQLTRSELLIKPCLEKLTEDGVISINNGQKYNYDKLLFSDIILSEKGKRMVEDGLFPGKTTEIPLEIKYNPLFEQMFQSYENFESDGTEISFDENFPRNILFPDTSIIDSLNNGLVGNGRFIASKMRIEAVECLSESPIELVTNVEVDFDGKNNIIITPAIHIHELKKNIEKLFFTKEIQSNMLPDFAEFDSLNVHNIIGSGNRIKNGISDICKGSKFIGMDSVFYERYKRYTSLFKDKTIILWNSDSFSIEKTKSNSLIISLPDKFIQEGCVVINENNRSISICKKQVFIDDISLNVPILIESNESFRCQTSISGWLDYLIVSNYLTDYRYLVLYTLPNVKNRSLDLNTSILEIFRNESTSNIKAIVGQMDTLCKAMNTKMFSIETYSDVIAEKILNTSSSDVLELLSVLYRSKILSTRNTSHKIIVDMVFSIIDKPSTPAELIDTLQKIGITTHEDAVYFDYLADEIYSHEYINIIMSSIIDDSFSLLPELFEFDSIINNIYKSIAFIHNILNEINLFKEHSDNELSNYVLNCKEPAFLNSNLAKLIDSKFNCKVGTIDLYDSLRQCDESAFYHFETNIEKLYKEVSSKKQEDYIKDESVYIIDTCAFINQPELLLYFKDSDIVRIPTTVIDELSKIKDMRSKKYSFELSSVAQRISSDIDSKYMILFNENNQQRLLIENAPISLLPLDLDPTVHDNQILSVALNYANHNVAVITDDKGMRLVCSAQNIKTFSSNEFIELNKIYKKTLFIWEEQYEKKQGKISYPSKLKNSSNNIDSNGDESINSLLRILPNFNSAIIEYLKSNGVATINDFKTLTSNDVEGFSAKGKQMVYKNTIIRGLQQLYH